MKQLSLVLIFMSTLVGCASTSLPPLIQPDGLSRVPINTYSVKAVAQEAAPIEFAMASLATGINAAVTENASVYFLKSSAEYVPTEGWEKILSKAKNAESIKITGYTSGDFSKPANVEVAKQRAISVQTWLLNHGVDEKKTQINEAQDTTDIEASKKWRVDLKFVNVGEPISTELYTMESLRGIAAATKLMFSSRGFPEETLSLGQNSDPLSLLRSIAKKTSYGVLIDRPHGEILLRPISQGGDLMVIEDKNPVVFMGSPILLDAMPTAPITLERAMRLLVPDGWNVGFENGLEQNIFVDMSQVKDWKEGLLQLALQTPYRLVWDWSKRQLFAVSLKNHLYTQKD